MCPLLAEVEGDGVGQGDEGRSNVLVVGLDVASLIVDDLTTAQGIVGGIAIEDCCL